MARTMSSDEYQELGKRYYKHKQYEKAVEAFSAGIEAAVNPSISLLDYRAASYDKLKVFNSALKDGREMIKYDKKNIKGYLRVGSVLQKVNQLDKAISIYKYGMKNVPIDNKDFKFLQQLHDKLTRQLSPAKAVDPFTVLPVELVEMVIGYLTFRNLVNCLRVSKAWKTYLIRCPNLWTNLDLSGARRDVSRTFVRNAVNYSGYRVNRFVIHRFRHTDVLRNIATACKNLSDLEVLSGGLMADTIIEIAQCASNLKRLVMRTDVTLDTVGQILRYGINLEHAEFKSVLYKFADLGSWKGPFPNLHTLYLERPLTSDSSVTSRFGNILSQTPALRSLKLTCWPHFSPCDFRTLPLTHLCLQNCGLLDFPKLPTTLHQLVLSPQHGFPLPTQFDPTALHLRNSWTNAEESYVPKLNHLSLENCLSLSSTFLSLLLDTRLEDPHAQGVHTSDDAGTSKLQHLSINHCKLDQTQHESLFGPSGLLTHSPRILSSTLQSLYIVDVPCADDDIEALITYPTSLSMIDVSRTQVTGAGLKLLIDHIPTLESIIADDCNRISSRDIVQYAESRGVTVSMKSSATMGRGKTVRYG